MFVLSNCTEGRRNILCCRNQHWKGKSVNKSGTSKLQQPGRLRPKGWCVFGLSANPGGWGQEGPVENEEVSWGPSGHLSLSGTAPITLHQPLGYEHCFPGIPTTLCPVASSGVLLELWSLSWLRAIVVTPYNLCSSQVIMWKKGTAHLPLENGKCRERCGAGTQKLQPQFSTIVFPKNEK